MGEQLPSASAEKPAFSGGDRPCAMHDVSLAQHRPVSRVMAPVKLVFSSIVV